MEYSGKLLLFGEHVVVQGAQALALPLTQFRGRWAFAEDPQKGIPEQYQLPEWLEYLRREQAAGQLGCRLDLDRFSDELKQGIFFSSNIPPGYGAGSSGALCAALYDRYALDPIHRDHPTGYGLLKGILGKMESFFHGASSGADPLVCYLARPLLFDHKGIIRAVNLPDLSHSGVTLFLLDTGVPRKTGALVQVFREWCRDSVYLARVVSELIPSTEDAIHLFLSGEWDALFEEWHILSHFQYRYMQQMILPSWEDAWLACLSGTTHKLKLCGAGGGGFVLGISRSWEETQAAFKPFHPLRLEW